MPRRGYVFAEKQKPHRGLKAFLLFLISLLIICALVFGAGAFSSNPSKNLLWSAGVRLVVDMTRIEKEGIVEIKKGATYREASPLKLWNFQFNLAFYF